MRLQAPASDVLKICYRSCRKGMRWGLYRCGPVQRARTACQALRYSLLLSQPPRSAPFTLLTASETRTLPSGSPNRPRGPRRCPRVASRRAHYINHHHITNAPSLRSRRAHADAVDTKFVGFQLRWTNQHPNRTFYLLFRLILPIDPTARGLYLQGQHLP